MFGTYRILVSSMVAGLCVFCGIFLPSQTHSLSIENPYNNITRVSTIERPPFVMVEGEEVSGFSIELREEIAERLEIEYTIEVETVFSQMLDNVSSKKADLAVANISITADREEVMDFSHPIYDSGLHMLIQDDGGPKYFRQGLVLSWQCKALLGTVLTLLLLLYFVRKKIQHLQVKNILSLLLVAGIFVCLFFIGLLMQQNKNDATSKMGGYQYLYDKQVGAAEGTTMAKFLQGKNISYTPYEDFAHSLAALEEGEVEVILGDAAVAHYYVAHEGKGKVKIIGKLFAPDKLAIAFQEDSPLLEQIDTVLLEIREDGTYKKLEEKYFGY